MRENALRLPFRSGNVGGGGGGGGGEPKASTVVAMGKRRGKALIPRSHTLPSSPSHSFSSSSSSSSSDFEFTVSVSPLNKSSSALCVADELFYKGQLLPLQLSPRLSMVRTLLASSSDSASATSSSRDSSGSSTDSQYSSSSSSSSAAASAAAAACDCDSSRPSSVTEDDEFRRLHCRPGGNPGAQIRKGKYFLARFSSVFRKEHGKGREAHYGVSGPSSSTSSSSSVKKRVSATAKEVIRKYLKKVKPLYEKLSQKQQQQQSQQKSEISPPPAKTSPRSSFSQPLKTERTVREIMLSSGKSARKDGNGGAFSNSFSGNLRYPRRRTCASSCPSSMRSSPSHSGVLCRSGFGGVGGVRTAAGGGGGSSSSSEASSTEELQSAIQGAIAHCKSSMLQNNYKVMISNEI